MIGYVLFPVTHYRRFYVLFPVTHYRRFVLYSNINFSLWKNKNKIQSPCTKSNKLPTLWGQCSRPLFQQRLQNRVYKRESTICRRE
ncbi:hypothetical protein M378DRAFT_1012782 [Amanita muscaria Koide BX008]|uniref:Uncharacterized protein n=1 Tax=Amanita muscaria (strain Koide BX008) TaxID=946122 RepID=A0A0C2WD70_AMAMK|nr:hypothetical protein M378DRAFT_1012782 [Amanita muscaria Koide BX008]